MPDDAQRYPRSITENSGGPEHAAELHIFVSYSHRDRGYLAADELLGFLRGLERDGDVRFWQDEKLAGGTRWDDEIRKQIDNSSIALVLVSQAFLDSPYCVDVEMARFLEKRRDEGLRIFPVILSACEWDRHRWLAERQCLPGGDETIEEHYADPGRRKRLYLRIRKELRQLVDEVRQSKDKEAAPKRGTPLAERRRVTLLECAVTLQSDDDPVEPDDEIELLYEAAPLFRDCVTAQVQALEGHIVGESPGGVLACFGYPAVHEDDSVRGIRAALGIVQAVKNLSGEFRKRMGVGITARIGVQTGFVINSNGAAAHQELQQGEVRSIASLLQVNAPPEGVMVGESTARLIRGFFRMGSPTDLEHPALRRKIRSCQVLEDLGAGSRFYAARLQGLTPIVGRERELDLILEAWQSARSGLGKMAVITADAGIGKSRLLEEVRRSVASQPHHLVECQCSPYHRNSALFPVTQALRKWLALQPNDAPEIQRQHLEAAVRQAGLQPGEVMPFLAELLGIPGPRKESGPLTARQQKEGTFQAILLLIAGLANSKPVLIAVEDLHWMDASTEELLSVLLDELRELPVLVVATARQEFHVPAAWTERDHCVPVKIGPLSAAQVTDMMRRLAGGKNLPGAVALAIFEKTEGCPLFVEDLTHMVLESDLLDEHDGVYVARRKFESLSIPDTLGETLMARLSRVDDARMVAQLGAVIGREFSYDMIEAIAPMDSEVLKESLGKLVSACVLHRRGLTTRAHYAFKHALEQDVLYQSLLKRERRRYHLEIAQAIETRMPEVARTEPELMAHHFREGGVHETAVKYLIKAGEEAIRNCANVEAIAHARNALTAIQEILDPLERGRLELRVQVMHGPALLAVKGWAAPELGVAYERAKELLPCEDNPEQRFRITRGLWGYYMVSSQLESSLGLAQELMRLAEEADSDEYRLEAHVTFCDSYFWMGRPDLAADHAEHGLALYDFERHHTHHSLEYGEDPSVIFHCYGALSHWLLGNARRAEEIVTEARASVERYTHLFSRGFLLNGIAWYYIHTGNPTLAGKYGLALKKLSIDHDFPPWRALAMTHCGWAMGATGDVEAGASELRAGMTDLRATGVVITKVLNCALLAETFQRNCQFARALECVAEGLAHAAENREGHYLPELYRLRGELLSLTGGSVDETEADYRKAFDIAREQKALVFERKAAASLDSMHCAAVASA